MAAAALRTRKSALGAHFRRLCSRVDKPKAVSAAAPKLARPIYVMRTKGEDYVDPGQDYYAASSEHRWIVANSFWRASLATAVS